jgi:hypothetical protein
MQNEYNGTFSQSVWDTSQTPRSHQQPRDQRPYDNCHEAAHATVRVLSLSNQDPCKPWRVPTAKRKVKIHRRSPVDPANATPASEPVSDDTGQAIPKAPTPKRRRQSQARNNGRRKLSAQDMEDSLLGASEERPAVSEEGGECDLYPPRTSRFPVRATRSAPPAREGSVDDSAWGEEDEDAEEKPPSRSSGGRRAGSKRGSVDSRGGGADGVAGDIPRHRGVTRKCVSLK